MQRDKESPSYIIFVFLSIREGRRRQGTKKGALLRIDSSVIGMDSARRYSSSTVRGSRFMVKDYRNGAANSLNSTFGNLFDTGGALTDGKNTAGETKDGSMASKDTIEELRERVESMRSGRVTIRNTAASRLDSFRQSAIRSIFSMIFGGGRLGGFWGNTSLFAGIAQSSSENTITLSNEQVYDESESTAFSTTGIVRTQDGREISINVDVAMSRRFTQYFKEELQIPQAVNTCDPLVINFDGNVAELSDQKFFFDIDGDGEKDEISYLGSGSGYLALDKNGDGVINDGNELFGPQTGNGFNDLAKYDADGNGWIDENDPIWSQLKIWCKNEDGTETLYTLAEKGLGAICLQNAATDFALNNAQNQTNGYIRSTGIFLYENGNVGTVQHLDVAK